MKLPPSCIRIPVQLFCLLGLMSCQTRKPEAAPNPAHLLNKPEPVAPGDMKAMEDAKKKI